MRIPPVDHWPDPH